MLIVVEAVLGVHLPVTLGVVLLILGVVPSLLRPSGRRIGGRRHVL